MLVKIMWRFKVSLLLVIQKIDSVLPESEYLSGKLFVDEKITTPSKLAIRIFQVFTDVVMKSSASVNKEFKSHFAPTPKVKTVAPLYNPNAQNALVLFSPPDGTAAPYFDTFF